MTVKLTRCSARRLAEQRPVLVELLRDVVADGASVGFLHPLAEEVATAYWADVEAALAHGHRELLLAEKDGVLVGTAQLELAQKPNARHRAEVTKLLVHPRARRQGVGRLLLHEVEQLARSHGRTLLFLDTREGDVAEHLYRGEGYLQAGRIPNYVRSETGRYEATILYYRLLEAASG
ncbi:MAG: N-acetyltransferase family protein [Myxococcaceae bacterium]